MTGLAIAYALSGRPDEAGEAFERARALYAAMRHYSQVAASAIHQLKLVALPYRTADIDLRRRLEADFESALELSRGTLSVDDWTSYGHIPLLCLEGKWAEARAIGDVAMGSRFGVSSFSLDDVAALARDQGRVSAAWDVIHRLLPDGPDSEVDQTFFGPGSRLQRVAVDLALDVGDLQLAAEWIAAHQRWLDLSGATVYRPHHKLLLARHERVSGRLDQALVHAERALEIASDPAQPPVTLAAHRTLGELLTASGRHAEAANHLREAVSLADACAAPFERALTLVAQAELAVATNDDPAALLAEAREICERLEARPTLERIAAITC